MKSEYKSVAIALVVCKNAEGKWLVVEETGNRGYNLPTGSVEDNESFHQGAIRETMEETGLDLKLTGILRVEYGLYPDYLRLKTVFFGVPKDEKQKLKTIPDKHSVQAIWMSKEELEQIGNNNQWRRCPELYDWACYLDNNGIIYPLTNMQEEGTATMFQDASSIKTTYSTKHSKAVLKVGLEPINEFMLALEKSDESWFLRHGSKNSFNSFTDASGNTMLHLASLSKNRNFIQSCIFISESHILSAVNGSKLSAIAHWKQSGVSSDLIELLARRSRSKLDNSVNY